MNTVMDTPQDQPRAEARKSQVLNAATDCFRRHGFHGASMAQISKTAGMSVGHIYHYFANKEAIIASIVERDLLNLLTITNRIRTNSPDGDIFRAQVANVGQCVDEIVHDQGTPLMLEILAEAARNPNVANIIQQADRIARQGLRELILEGLRFRGLHCSDSCLEGSLQVLSSLFEGLSIRMIRNPELDMHSLLPALRGVMTFILDELTVQAARQPA